MRTLSPPASSASRRDAFDLIDIRVVPLIIAAFLGHSAEHLEAGRKKLNEALSRGEISQDEYKERMKMHSQDNLDAAFREFFAQWSKDKETKPFDLTRTVEEARRKTFDKHGRPKESPLIPIYRVMLHNWVAIENMSGPKELAAFLAPHLKGKSKSATGELARIATLCTRLGLKFRARSKTFELRRRRASV